MKIRVFANKIMAAAAVSLLLLVAAACEEHEQQSGKLCLTLVMPSGYEDYDISKVEISAKNVNTGRVVVLGMSRQDGDWCVVMDEGLYDVTVSAVMRDGDTDELSAIGYKEAVYLKSSDTRLSIDMVVQEKDKGGWVIAEIFFTGTVTPQGKQYNGDKYFRIFNNSDSVMYADGIILLEADFLTVSKRNYTPDIMSEAFTVQALYRVPGDGTTYPVQPGHSILIVDNALDHRSANPNSFDLTKADFEWYDVSTRPSVLDVENPEVTNLEKIYCYTLTIWVPHNRGFSSYAIGRLPDGMTPEQYLKDYYYDYEYDLVTTAGDFHMSGSGYKFPNEWILDAVNLSVEASFEWIVTAPSLDRGWTHVGSIDHDKSRYGKAVRRKYNGVGANGRLKLKDTNNSTEDFDAEVSEDPYYLP